MTPLSSPVDDPEPETAASRVLFMRLVAWVAVAAVIIVFIFEAATGTLLADKFATPTVYLAVALVTLFALRRRRARLAALILVWGMLCALGSTMLLFGGLQAPIVSLVVLVAGIAGWLLGQRSLLAVAAMCMLLVVTTYFMQASGLLLAQEVALGRRMVVLLAIVAVAVGLTWYIVKSESRASAALKASEEQYRAMTLLSADWFWETDAQFRLTRVAGKGLEKVGLSPEAMLGRRSEEFGNIAPLGDSGERFRLARDARKPYRDVPMGVRLEDGSYRYVSLSAEPMFAADGTFRGYRGVTRDVTEQYIAITEAHQSRERIEKINAELDQRVQDRTAELRSVVAKLEEANRDLDSFNFSIAHDLRQPLNAIGGFADLLGEDFAGEMSDEGREFAREIQTNAQRMEQMIEALLRFSNVGRGTLDKGAIDMREQVDSVLQDLSVEAPLRAEVLIGELPPVQGDEKLLRHVWANLIGNAFKYSGKNPAPKVEISGARQNGLLEYTVRDNGVGFDMRDAAHIFGVFQRLPSSSGFEGSGVGLAIVERIVRRHGGRISADSVPGEGATFRFTLPG